MPNTVSLIRLVTKEYGKSKLNGTVCGVVIGDRLQRGPETLSRLYLTMDRMKPVRQG
jgi:hypothetical protein